MINEIVPLYEVISFAKRPRPGRVLEFRIYDPDTAVTFPDGRIDWASTPHKAVVVRDDRRPVVEYVERRVND